MKTRHFGSKEPRASLWPILVALLAGAVVAVAIGSYLYLSTGPQPT